MAKLLSINLSPEKDRNTAISSAQQFHRMPLVWIIVGILIAIPFLLWLPADVQNRQLERVKSQIATLKPKRDAVEALTRLTKRLRAQEEAFRGLGAGRFHWAKRLNVLSSVLPEGMWLTELALDWTKGLMIQGSAIAQGGTEMVNIGRMVQSLQENENFTTAISDMQIESIKRFQDGTIEIVQFTLTGKLADVQGL